MYLEVICKSMEAKSEIASREGYKLRDNPPAWKQSFPFINNNSLNNNNKQEQRFSRLFKHLNNYLLSNIHKMKVISIISFLSVAMAVSADSCNRGGVYCGTSLLNKGES